MKTSTKVLIGVSIAVIVVGGYFGYKAYQKKKDSTVVPPKDDKKITDVIVDKIGRTADKESYAAARKLLAEMNATDSILDLKDKVKKQRIIAASLSALGWTYNSSNNSVSNKKGAIITV